MENDSASGASVYFGHILVCTLVRLLVFMFELFYICHLGTSLLADYVVWALFIVEGHTVTYDC